MENILVKNSIKALINLEPQLAENATLEEYVSLIFLKNVILNKDLFDRSF